MLSEGANVTILLLCGGLIGLLIGLAVVLRIITEALPLFRWLLPLVRFLSKDIATATSGVLDKFEFAPRWELPAYVAVGALCCLLVGMIWLSPVRIGWWPLIGGVVVGLLGASAVLVLAAASVSLKVLLPRK
jgi:hypothetical protein